jgi:hypothetical protein
MGSHPADPLEAVCLPLVDGHGARTYPHEAGSGDPLGRFHGGHVGVLDCLNTWSLNRPAEAGDLGRMTRDALNDRLVAPRRPRGCRS